MKTKFAQRVMAAGLSCILLASTVHAEVTISASNDPSAVPTDKLDVLFGAERNVLDTLDSDDISLLMTVPEIDMTDMSYTKGWVDTVPFRRAGREWECLAEALYFEARGESVRGIFGVAEVILNRVESPVFPDSVCGVVNQGTGKRYQCQFTYTCDGKPETIREQKAYQKVGKIAMLMLEGAPRQLTAGATHYHTKSVNPSWARVFPKTTTIGYHIFYRNPKAVRG